MDQILGVINRYCNAGMGLLAILFPISTNFVGVPALAFMAATLFLASFFLYLIKIMDLRTILSSNEGRRALPREARRTACTS
jgi:hypothetical protein